MITGQQVKLSVGQGELHRKMLENHVYNSLSCLSTN